MQVEVRFAVGAEPDLGRAVGLVGVGEVVVCDEGEGVRRVVEVEICVDFLAAGCVRERGVAVHVVDVRAGAEDRGDDGDGEGVRPDVGVHVAGVEGWRLGDVAAGVAAVPVGVWVGNEGGDFGAEFIVDCFDVG